MEAKSEGAGESVPVAVAVEAEAAVAAAATKNASREVDPSAISEFARVTVSYDGVVVSTVKIEIRNGMRLWQSHDGCEIRVGFNNSRIASFGKGEAEEERARTIMRALATAVTGGELPPGVEATWQEPCPCCCVS